MRRFFRTEPYSKFEFTLHLHKLEPWPAPRPGEKPTALVLTWQRGQHVRASPRNLPRRPGLANNKKKQVAAWRSPAAGGAPALDPCAAAPPVPVAATAAPPLVLSSAHPRRGRLSLSPHESSRRPSGQQLFPLST